MPIAEIPSAGLHNTLTSCPVCGGCIFEDNRIDERPYQEAAKEAPRLRYEGCVDDVIDVLGAFYAIRVINFIRPRWRCECGVTFDD